MMSWSVGADHQILRLLLLLTGTELEGALDADDIRELVLPPPGELFTIVRGHASLICKLIIAHWSCTCCLIIRHRDAYFTYLQ